MMASLKRRLLWTLLGLILFAWVSSAVMTYFYANRVLLQQVDRQLEQYADLVSYITDVFAKQIEDDLPLYEKWTGHDYDQAHLEPMVIDGPVSEGLTPAVNIWEGENLIAVVENSPRFPRPLRAGISSRDMPGGVGQWRTLALQDKPNGLWIHVGIELGAARQSMLETLGRALLPLLIVLPLTVIVLYLGVARGLLPLRHLADQISHRKAGQLDPVDTEAVPEEVAGLVNSLNSLLVRLATALESEQRFTANAAHELMTPLAAIKTEVQLCQRQLKDEEGVAMLARIGQRVDRASHTVEQLLALARVDPDAPMKTAPVELRSLLVEVTAETAHLAPLRNLTVELGEGPEVTLVGNSEALAIMMRNLLVNAFRYATPGSKVVITLSKTGELHLCNDCEPLSSSEFEHLWDRFYRVPGSDGLGVGLGLSIVGRIAQLHDASLCVEPQSGARGFCIRVAFIQSNSKGA